MRIGIDAQLLGRPGGVGGTVAGLVGALAEFDRRNEYVIYAPPDVAMPDGLPEGRFRVVRTPFTDRRPWRILWQQWRLPARLRKDGCDLLHAPSYIAPLRGDTPVVLTLHDVIALTHPELCSRLNAAHYRRRMPECAARATIIVASSETTKRDILRTLDVPASKVRVIYPGVSPRFAPQDDARVAAVRTRLGLPERFLLFVGNIEPKKGLPTLLAAHAALDLDAKPDLVIAGAAQRGAEELQRSAGEGVHFIGRVADDDLPALYTAAAAFVFPSLYEGFGLPPLEAMACDTPVVCSDAGSLPEVTGEDALSFPAGDARALAAAIRDVLTDRALRMRLTAAGRGRVRRFRWRTAVEDLRRAYADAAGAR